jgi:hypothetical protein
MFLFILVFWAIVNLDLRFIINLSHLSLSKVYLSGSKVER